MAISPSDVWNATLSGLETYVFPYLFVLVIAFLTVGLGFGLSRRGARGRAKKSLRAELRTNIAVTKAIVTYADSQLSGDTSVAPMPTYRTHAFVEYSRAGLLDKIPKKIGVEVEQMYLSMVSVNKAGRRQEDLAFGPAAAFPNAHTLRLENLTYARDTAHNIIEPYQDRLREVKL